MKTHHKIIASLGILLFVSGCGGGGSDSTTATVIFKNVATDTDVCALWNDQQVGPIQPGGSSSVTADPGANTMQWTNCNGTNLTNVSTLDVEAGHTYTYTYDPADYNGGTGGTCDYYYDQFKCGEVVNGIEYIGGLVPDECSCPTGTTFDSVDTVTAGGPWNMCICD